MTAVNLTVHPLTPARWADFERLFGPSGAYGGCWCMWFRLRRKELDHNSGQQNKQAMHELVGSGVPPGLIAYIEGEPVGWVSLGPRTDFPHLEHSRTLRRIDDRPVWSIVCFVVGAQFRGRGLMSQLLEAATDYARPHGAATVEAYPIEPGGTLTGCDGYTGIASAFRRAGFVEVARASERQVIMRYRIDNGYGNG